MSVKNDDKRAVLYAVAADLLRRGMESQESPDFDLVSDTRRGMGQFYELVLHGLDASRMDLDHLAAVANQALKQIRGEWGLDSREERGALFALTTLLGCAKGADEALSHAILRPYRPG